MWTIITSDGLRDDKNKGNVWRLKLQMSPALPVWHDLTINDLHNYAGLLFRDMTV